jgi:hypothetical protein
MTKDIEEQEKIIGLVLIARLNNGSNYQVLVKDSEVDTILNYISNMSGDGNIKLILPALNSLEIT